MPHTYRVVAEPGRDGCPGKQIEAGGSTPLALFDLDKNPYEKNNIAEKYPGITGCLSALVADFQKEIDREMEVSQK